MKKLPFVFVLIIFPILLSAQCNIKTEKDEFNGSVSRSSASEVLCRSWSDGTLKMKISQFIDKQDTSMSLFVYLEPMSMSCFNDESKILLKSGEIIKEIKLSGKIDCAGQGNILIDYGMLTDEDIVFLKTHFIEAIRVYLSEGYNDYSIKKADYFIRTMMCF
jgi:hypothetical protein